MSILDALGVLLVSDPVAGTVGLGLAPVILVGATLYVAGRLYKKFRG